MPAPIPMIVLAMISSTRCVESRLQMPLSRNITVPMTSIRILFLSIDQRPASSIKGIIISEGNDSSIDTSSSVECGNIRLISSSIGEMASPGSDTTADTESIATSVTRGIAPLPVLIFIASFSQTKSNSHATHTICFSGKDLILLHRYF